MKRFKDLLLSIFIFGSTVVIIFIILSFFNVKRTVDVTNTKSNEIRYNNLKQRVNMLAEGECKTFLNEYIANTDKGYFEGEVKLKKLYDYYWNYPTMKYYELGKEKCNITQNELDEYGVPGKYLTLMTLPDSLFDKYMFTYELNLKSELRNLVEPSIDSLLYSSIRFQQIEILNDYVTLAELKEETNE